MARDSPNLTRQSLFARVHGYLEHYYLSSDSSPAFPLMRQGQGAATTRGTPALGSTGADLTLRRAAGAEDGCRGSGAVFRQPKSEGGRVGAEWEIPQGTDGRDGGDVRAGLQSTGENQTLPSDW